MNARIVGATEDDLAAVSQLAASIWRAHYPGIISTEQIEYMLAKMYSIDTLRDELCVRGIRYDRLLAGGEFAGFASYGVLGDSRSGACNCRTVKLHKLYLHPNWHGKGLGTLLLQHCERQARGAGARRLVLTVNKRNSKAIAAYQRNGFAIVQSVIEDIGGGFVMDDYVMEKELT
jgi:GNAT superfamily N-acetyltransferase